MIAIEPLTDGDQLRRPDDEVRGRIFSFGGPGTGREPGPLHGHQTTALERIEAAGDLDWPVSGIVHYPTGAGKTRVGIQLMARALSREPTHRFVWATHTTNLLQQSMRRLAECSVLFPPWTTFTWLDSAMDLGVHEEVAASQIVFMTRHALTASLSQAWAVSEHPWRRHLSGGAALTLIYDECHQLGADGLQVALKNFSETLERARRQRKPRRWRVIGLSATPVPTRTESHRVLSKFVFPKRNAPTCHDWPFHVFHRVRNETLVESGVLCNPTDFFDRNGDFDLPQGLLRDVIDESRLSPPARDADRGALMRYAQGFNTRVLSHPRVIEFLADRVGRNLRLLGKTIVFLPNIEAANRMAAELYRRFPDYRGRIAAVHSKMRELDVPGQEEVSVEAVLDGFRKLDSQPSVLVNVEMLTEGFDDPKIRTVVLARLTLSTNRFWQMIGRGTRGPASNGTTECYVIDPVKLTRIYDYFGGYQPSFAKEDDVDIEDDEERGGGQDRIPPQVPLVSRPPDPAYGGYRVDPELERVRVDLARALAEFLAGRELTEAVAIDAAMHSTIELTGGAMTFRASPTPRFDETTAIALLLGQISNIERRTKIELTWFRRQIPAGLDEGQFRGGLRMLSVIEALDLRTAAALSDASATEQFKRMMSEPAGGSTAPAPPTSAGPGAMSARELAVLDAAVAIALADGAIVSAEVDVVVETLRRMFGRMRDEALVADIAARKGPLEPPRDLLQQALSASERQFLILQLAEVAGGDGIVTATERSMVSELARALDVSTAFVDAVIGSYPNAPEADHHDTIPAPPPREADSATQALRSRTEPLAAHDPACWSCRFTIPHGSLFCPACGSSLATTKGGAFRS